MYNARLFSGSTCIFLITYTNHRVPRVLTFITLPLESSNQSSSLHGLAPPYLSDDCQLVTDGRGTSTSRVFLPTSRPYTFVVPRTQSQIGDRSFSVAGPQRSGAEALRSNIIDDYLRRFCSFRLRRIVTFT